MLYAGNPPNTMAELLAVSTKLQAMALPGSEPLSKPGRSAIAEIGAHRNSPSIPERHLA
jgi:hypothetical protein